MKREPSRYTFELDLASILEAKARPESRLTNRIRNKGFARGGEAHDSRRDVH